MNLPARLLLWLAFAGVAVCAFYLWAVREDPALAERLAAAPREVRELVVPTPGGPGTQQVAPPAVVEDAAPPALPDPSLPTLDDSDTAVNDALGRVLGAATIKAWFNPQAFIRHLVVTLDNLPNARLPMRHRVVRAVPGTFEVTGAENALVPSPANAVRYAPLIDAVLKVDAAQWVKRYRRWYPLLQEAYAEIADRRQLFNDRMLDVLDHLIAVQVPLAPPALVQPGVLYRYADPALEAQSAGAHMLFRLGQPQSLRVQTRLREVRALLGGAQGTPARP